MAGTRFTFQSRFPHTPGEGIYDGEEGITAPRPCCNARACWSEPPPHPSITPCAHPGQGRDAGELLLACTMHRESKGQLPLTLGSRIKPQKWMLFSSPAEIGDVKCFRRAVTKKKRFLNRKRGQDLSAIATGRQLHVGAELCCSPSEGPCVSPRCHQPLVPRSLGLGHGAAALTPRAGHHGEVVAPARPRERLCAVWAPQGGAVPGLSV